MHPLSFFIGEVVKIILDNLCNLSICNWTNAKVDFCGYMLFGEWLGFGADEGRAKRRYALGRCKEPLNQR